MYENKGKEKILVLGGTGAMGKHLVKILSDMGYAIFVTSRSDHKSNGNVKYIKGNAKDNVFLNKTLKLYYWDAIVDFMSYNTNEFKNRVDVLLSVTKQYIFISSARVYADSKIPIIEESPRLLDVSTDKKYLASDEYALSKARQENILMRYAENNWTIVRPSITYNSQRLQLGELEKENWLRRALQNKTIVLSSDIAEKLTTMSTGYDVAKGISVLIGNEKAKGEAFHIVQNKSYHWKEILEIYSEVIEEWIGQAPKKLIIDTSVCLNIYGKRWQVCYGRCFNRQFDNSKISAFLDTENFSDPKEGLKICLNEFLENPSFGTIDYRIEAMLDQKAGEKTPLNEISSIKEKIIYFLYRYSNSRLLFHCQNTKVFIKKKLRKIFIKK